MHEGDVELFNDSIERCSCRSDFLNRFYTLFLASSDTVAKKFEHTDLRKQARVLKTSLYIMMSASGGPERTVHLERIAKLHSRAELLLYAATYHERTSALVLYGSYARRAWAPDHPFGVSPARMQGILETFERDWGRSVAMDIWSVRDTGAAASAERVHEVKRFEQDYFGNGQLHIINIGTGELIDRKDAYLPMNMYLDHEGAAAQLAYWKAFAEHRRERGRKFAEEMERNARGYDVKVTIGS